MTGHGEEERVPVAEGGVAVAGGERRGKEEPPCGEGEPPRPQGRRAIPSSSMAGRGRSRPILISVGEGKEPVFTAVDPAVASMYEREEPWRASGRASSVHGRESEQRP